MFLDAKFQGPTSLRDRARERLNKCNWCGEIGLEEEIEEINASAVTN